MKFIFAVLFSMPFSFLFSQQLQLTIIAGNNSITVSPEDNNDALFTLNTSTLLNNSFLTIHVDEDEIEKDWKRSFSIYDSADNAIKDFVLMKDGSYCIKITDIKTLFKPNQEYFIYTVALPKDPKKAMLVKVARTLVCKIKIL